MAYTLNLLKGHMKHSVTSEPAGLAAGCRALLNKVK